MMEPMTPAQFRACRLHLGRKQVELADDLGLSETQVGNYEAGQTRGGDPKPAPIPRTVQLALAALVLGVSGFDGLTVMLAPHAGPPLEGRGTGRRRAALPAE